MLPPSQPSENPRVIPVPIHTSSNPMPSSSNSQQTPKMRVIASSDGEESSDESDEEGGLAKLLGTKKSSHTTGATIAFKPPKPISKPMSKPKRELKFNMQKLQAGIRSNNHVQENRRKIEQYKKEMEQSALNPLKLDATTDRLFEVAIPSGDGQKLKRALQKKVDKCPEEHYEFFDSIVTSSQTPYAFPTGADSANLFHETDVATRETMFLSGFVRDTVECNGPVISDDQVYWLIHEVCVQDRSDLVFSYVKVLEAIAEDRRKDIFTPAAICKAFQAIGAKPENVQVANHLKPTMIHSRSRPKGSFWRLKLVARLLSNVIDCSDTNVLITTCSLLLRASIDVHVCLHSDVITALEDAVAVILSEISLQLWEEKSRMIGNALFNTFMRPQDRRQVIERLPIVTSHLHTFRRRLALSFLLDDVSFIQQPTISLPNLDGFCELIRKPPFVIHQTQNPSNATNYDQLEAMLNIMDIALDTGPTAGTPFEKDKTADSFEHMITMIEGRITDASMGHGKRTSSKESAERLKFRTAFTVRSKTKKGFEQLTLDRMGFGKQ